MFPTLCIASTATSLATRANVARLLRSVRVVEKVSMKVNGPHASSAKDCPVWQKEKESHRVRVEKRISFPEARQLVEAKMPTVITGGKTYVAAASIRRESKSVQCQTSLFSVT